MNVHFSCEIWGKLWSWRMWKYHWSFFHIGLLIRTLHILFIRKFKPLKWEFLKSNDKCVCVCVCTCVYVCLCIYVCCQNEHFFLHEILCLKGKKSISLGWNGLWTRDYECFDFLSEIFSNDFSKRSFSFSILLFSSRCKRFLI